MPVGKRKNLLYGLALPIIGKRCEWRKKPGDALEAVLHKHHVVGACIQRFEKGRLTDCHAVGFASLEEDRLSVTPDTVFRTASLAKTVTALLVMRLQTKGLLSVEEDVADLLGYAVRNPHHPDVPVTLGMLLSHTSSIVDPQGYSARMGAVSAQELLSQPDVFSQAKPGERFKYSNFGAGLIASALESRFGMGFDTLAQQELFEPLGVRASFDLTCMQSRAVADLYRVLPFRHDFDAAERRRSAKTVDAVDPAHHYVLASGNLFISAPDLARLTLVAWNGVDGFLNEKSLHDLQTPLAAWPEREVNIRHGMGLFTIDDEKISSRRIRGHQGFAYGAVNGLFFDEDGSGFVSLNSGASERRLGHLALINYDLIRLWMHK